MYGHDPDSAEVHLLVDADDDFHKDSGMTKEVFKGNFDSLIPGDIDRTGGLPHSIHLVRGAPVMLRRNVKVKDGLVNGSCGRIVHWTASGDVAYVRFPKVRGHYVGQDTRQKHIKYLEHTPMMKDKSIVPIVPEEATFMSAKGNFKMVRKALPLVLCWAITVHKSQGMSVEKVVIDLGSNTTPPASAYVALSRVTSLQGLYLLRLSAGAIKADKASSSA